MNTIVAISTAPGIGGIGIIRMSGEKSFEIIKKIFKSKKSINYENIEGNTIKYGYIIEKDKVIDEVLVSFFKAPNSYTTENVCEINSHGGKYVVKKILELCLEHGAELAMPGEFTKRAFLNGRIDLSQAEAVIDIINAKTEKEAKSSINQLEGSLSKDIAHIREQLMSIMVEIEVSIDYPEYDIEEADNKKIQNILIELRKNLQQLEDSFEQGKIIKEGISVTLLGRPNVGKSSLLNAILKQERAIVTEIEGTTRDVIEETIQVKGIPINIIDTAGIRDSNNKIEKIGIEKSRKSANESDLIIAIFDSSNNITKEDKEIIDISKDRNSIIILNKVDKVQNKETLEYIKDNLNQKTIIEISAKQRIGIEKIYDEIERLFEIDKINLDYNI